MPEAEDGAAVHRLIALCPPLDGNSLYCNLLQCTHFPGTCVLAQRNGEVLGWLSAYRPPADPSQIFVWQVAVHPEARGSGLGGRMLEALLARPAAAGAEVLTTTITEPNTASWALFRGFAQRLGAPFRSRPLFVRDRHFEGAHDTEHLVSIGPLGVSPTPDTKERS
jgi:L-2,4-diaminobutyric acid acetyltransferase